MTASTPARTTVSAVLPLVLLLIQIGSGLAAESSFEIDLKELDRTKTPAQATKKKSVKPSRPASSKSSTRKKAEQLPASAAGYVKYSVKSGDHIFKILMKDFGMSNSAAEALIPEIVRINNISDIKKLSIGQTILIPTGAKYRTAATVKGAPGKNRPEPPVRNKQPAITVTPQTPQTSRSLTEEPLVTAVAVRSIKTKDPSEIVDSLMNILALKWGKNQIIETSPGKGGGGRFSVKVDRYFEHNNKRFILSLSDNDPYTYTLFRLLEVEGYNVVRVSPTDDFAKIVSSLLTHLDITYRYAEHSLMLNDKNRTMTRVMGFLFTRDTIPPRQVLITESPVAALTAELQEVTDKHP